MQIKYKIIQKDGSVKRNNKLQAHDIGQTVFKECISIKVNPVKLRGFIFNEIQDFRVHLLVVSA